jgi:hypothetical protein
MQTSLLTKRRISGARIAHPDVGVAQSGTLTFLISAAHINADGKWTHTCLKHGGQIKSAPFLTPTS